MSIPRLITAILMATSLSCLNAAENLAVIVNILGDVYITTDQSATLNRARRGQVLVSGDLLETASKSSCVVKFLDDNSLMRLKENSRCKVEGTRRGDVLDKNIHTQAGSFFASLPEPGGIFHVTTPTSEATVKSGRVWILHNSESGATKYVTTEGVVEVRNSAGKVLVKGGQTVVVSARSRRPAVRLTINGEIPIDEERSTESQTLDVEFENANGEKRVLRIEMQEVVQ